MGTLNFSHVPQMGFMKYPQQKQKNLELPSTVTCGLRGGTGKPLWKSRVLSTEVIQAVHSLKLANSDSKLHHVFSTRLSRLLKADLLDTLAELQRQNESPLAVKIISYKQEKGIFVPDISWNRARFPPQIRYKALKFHRRKRHECLHPAHAISSEVENVGVSSQFEDFTVTTSSAEDGRELKIRVEVSGAKTRAIFNDVFDKMVADAQPIPGFRRVKGGKTPNIPREILLEVLGSSNVYRQVITKVINSTVAEYVTKESLSVGKDLRVEESIEDLEEMFEPDEIFSFGAVIQLQQTN